MSNKVIFGDASMRVYKAASTIGGEVEDLWFEGVLATTDRDKQGEAFTLKALQEVAAYISSTPLDVVDDTHKPGIANVVGLLDEAECRVRQDGIGELVIKGFLFGDDEANGKTHRLMGMGKVGMSMGAGLNYAYKAYQGGVETRYLDSVTPDHALVCRKGKAIGYETWTAPIAKAIEEAEAAENTDEVKKNMEDIATAAKPVPVEIVAVDTTPAPPSPNFADNVAQPSGEERFDEVWYEKMCAPLDALRETVRGICHQQEGDRVGLLSAALGDFNAAVLEAASEDIAKAGARHTAAEIKMMHTAMESLDGAKASIAKACGCDTCAGAVEKAEAHESEAEQMPDEEVVTKAEEASDATPAEETTTEESVATAETEAEATGEVAKAEAANETTEEAAPTIDEIVAKAVADAVKPLQDELAVLKAQPAEGGPAGKPSGDEQQIGTGVGSDEIAKARSEAAAAHDAKGYFKVVAADMVTRG